MLYFRYQISGLFFVCVFLYCHTIFSQSLDKILWGGSEENRKEKWTIGIILPLSGKFRSIGVSTLETIKIGIEHCGMENKIKLNIKDSQGEKSAEMVKELGSSADTLAIIGPLGRLESKNAIAVAEEINIPLLTLSGDEEINVEKKWIFNARLSKKELLKQLIDYLYSEKGLKEYAIIYPDNNYGNEMAQLFEHAFKEKGGVVKKSILYKELKNLSKIMIELTEKKQPLLREEKLGFQAVFIPDLPMNVKKLLSYMKYWGFPLQPKNKEENNLLLLGTPLWNNSLIIDTGENLTENAIFIDSFFPDEENIKQKYFITSFYEKYHRLPSSFEAEVYDAVMILLHSINNSIEKTREDIALSLKKIKDFNGVCGILSFNEKGILMKNGIILTIKNRKIQRVINKENDK